MRSGQGCALDTGVPWTRESLGQGGGYPPVQRLENVAYDQGGWNSTPPPPNPPTGERSLPTRGGGFGRACFLIQNIASDRGSVDKVWGKDVIWWVVNAKKRWFVISNGGDEGKHWNSQALPCCFSIKALNQASLFFLLFWNAFQRKFAKKTLSAFLLQCQKKMCTPLHRTSHGAEA